MPRDTLPPLTRCARFGIAPALAFATSSRRTCQVRRVGDKPPSALRSSTEPATSSHRAVLRRPDATSWRATWAEACEQPPVGGAKVPCAPTPQGSGTSRDPLLAEGPEHPLSSTRVRERLECRTRLGVITPWPTKIPGARRPPRRRRHFREPGCLDPLRRNGAGDGLPHRAGRPTSA
jgi:hypothetical protein